MWACGVRVALLGRAGSRSGRGSGDGGIHTAASAAAAAGAGWGGRKPVWPGGRGDTGRGAWGSEESGDAVGEGEGDEDGERGGARQERVIDLDEGDGDGGGVVQGSGILGRVTVQDAAKGWPGSMVPRAVQPPGGDGARTSDLGRPSPELLMEGATQFRAEGLANGAEFVVEATRSGIGGVMVRDRGTAVHCTARAGIMLGRMAGPTMPRLSVDLRELAAACGIPDRMWNSRRSWYATDYENWLTGVVERTLGPQLKTGTQGSAVAQLLSSDRLVAPDVHLVNAVAAGLLSTEKPIASPVAAVRVELQGSGTEENIVVNPGFAYRQELAHDAEVPPLHPKFELLYIGRGDEGRCLAMEGRGRQVPERIVAKMAQLAAAEVGKLAVPLREFGEWMRRDLDPTGAAVASTRFYLPADVVDKVHKIFRPRVETVLDAAVPFNYRATEDALSGAEHGAIAQVQDQMLARGLVAHEWVIQELCTDIRQNVFRDRLRTKGIRSGGRSPSEARKPVVQTAPFRPGVHGSSRVCLDDTHINCVVNLASLSDDYSGGRKPPKAFGAAVRSWASKTPLEILEERAKLKAKVPLVDVRVASPGKRVPVIFFQFNDDNLSKSDMVTVMSHSTQAMSRASELASSVWSEAAFEGVLPGELAFPYAVSVQTHVGSRGGGEVVAGVCAATLAMHDAGVPIEQPVAATAVAFSAAHHPEVDPAVTDPNIPSSLASVVPASVLEEPAVILSDPGELDRYLSDHELEVAGTVLGITSLRLMSGLNKSPYGISISDVERGLIRCSGDRLAVLEAMVDPMHGGLADPRPSLHGQVLPSAILPASLSSETFKAALWTSVSSGVAPPLRFSLSIALDAVMKAVGQSCVIRHDRFGDPGNLVVVAAKHAAIDRVRQLVLEANIAAWNADIDVKKPQGSRWGEDSKGTRQGGYSSFSSGRDRGNRDRAGDLSWREG